VANSGTLLPSGTWAVATFVAAVLSALISIGVVLVVLVRLPSDAFSRGSLPWPASFPGRLLRIGINLLGWVLILVGIVLSIPGVPGQGVLTILVGTLLIDFPGKAVLLRKLLQRPAVRRSVDRIRARFGRPPFTG
jgi:hypothetical protein